MELGPGLAPDAHEARVLIPIGAGHEAGIVGAKGGREHARAPGPVHLGDMDLRPEAALGLLPGINHLVDLLDVHTGHGTPREISPYSY